MTPNFTYCMWGAYKIWATAIGLEEREDCHKGFDSYAGTRASSFSGRLISRPEDGSNTVIEPAVLTITE